MERSEEDSEGGLVRVLRVVGVERADGGRYACTARNEHGKDEAWSELQVLEVPEAPVMEEVEVLEEGACFIRWKAPFDGNSKVTEYAIELVAAGSAEGGEVV